MQNKFTPELDQHLLINDVLKLAVAIFDVQANL
jgi:hypothetical protein